MTLEGLIAEYRVQANDGLDPPWVTDPQLWTFFAEAEAEAAIRGRLIHDAADVLVVAGTSTYRLPSLIYEPTYLSFSPTGGERSRVRLVSAEYLDSQRADFPSHLVSRDCDYWYSSTQHDWRDDTGTPVVAIQGDNSLRLIPNPDAAGVLHVEGYRLPPGPLGSDPEINPTHHRKLIQWALYRGFSIPGAEQQDSAKAAVALGEFERYFGQRPDSDLRRATRIDVPHHVTAHFP